MDDQGFSELTYNEVKEMREDINKIKIDIATLKVKAGIWGLMGGVIPVVLLMLKNLA